MKTTLLLLFMLLAKFALAQPAQFGAWYNFFGSKQVGRTFNIHHEVQYRNYNAIGDLEQLLVRTGLGYNLTENNNNVLLGYGYVAGENYSGAGDTKVQTYEHRVFQQFITKQNFGRLSFQHRYRVEERFLDENLLFRGRYFLGVTVALNNKTLENKTIYFSAYNELFVQEQKTKIGNDSSSHFSFDRNRVYAGLGYQLQHNLKFELAYMNQYITKSTQRDQLNIGCFFSF